MAVLLSSTDLAVALADRSGALRVVERASRFGGTFVSFEDAVGVIEVHMTREAADARLSAIRGAVR